MITVKDFARERGCGESIVYRHIRNHREELGDRIQKLHGRTWITPEGVSFIKNLMTQQMVIEEKAAPEVENLQKQIKEQAVTIEMQKNIIEAMRLKFEELQAEKLRLTEGMEQRLLEAVQKATEATREADRVEHAQEIQSVRDELQEELDCAIGVFNQEKKQLEDKNHLLQNALQAESTRKLTLRERITGKKKAPAVPELQEG